MSPKISIIHCLYDWLQDGGEASSFQSNTYIHKYNIKLQGEIDTKKLIDVIVWDIADICKNVRNERLAMMWVNDC